MIGPHLSWAEKTKLRTRHGIATLPWQNSVVEEWKIHTIHFWDGGLHAVLAFLARAQPGALVQYHMVQKIEYTWRIFDYPIFARMEMMLILVWILMFLKSRIYAELLFTTRYLKSDH